jgi:transcriptional regulator with XRE-family HTH domain
MRGKFGMKFEQLKVHLVEQGLTQKELADKLGTVPRTISRWKKDGIPKKHHHKILRILNIENLELIESDHAVTGFKNLSKPPLKRVSAKITFSAANSYLFIEEEYGINKQMLIEMAPLLLNCIASVGLSGLEKTINKEDDLISKIPKDWGPKNEKAQVKYENIRKAVKEENFFKYGHFEAYISNCMHSFKNCGIHQHNQFLKKKDKTLNAAFQVFNLKLFKIIGMFGKGAFPEKIQKHFVTPKTEEEGGIALHILDYSKIRNADGSINPDRMQAELINFKKNWESGV